MRDNATILWLDPRTLIEDPDSVRHETPELEGLAESLKQYGVLQPLGVSRHADKHHVIYGTRRRRAAVIAGLDRVPCIELTADRLVCQLLENVQRTDLNDMEKSEGFGRLKEQFSLTHRDLSETKLDELTARTIGVSPSTIRRYLRLRDLPTGVRALIRANELNVTQAQHLFAVSDGSQQEEMARLAADRGLSAATIARACGLLVARPGITVTDAISGAERGEMATGGPRAMAEIAHIRPQTRPQVESEGNEDRELWGDEAVTDDDIERARREKSNHPSAVDAAFADASTADGNRVFRIHTIDGFCDEVARLARCVADGDLARAMQKDNKARIKLDLARRQIEYTLRSLNELTSEMATA